MRFGLHIAGFYPEDLPDLAVACDESGWDHMAFPDAPFFPEIVETPYPYTPDGKRNWALTDPMLDPWPTISYLAALTKRLRFMTAILRMPIRKPLMEGKMACTVGVLTGGRLAVGMGLGWMAEEFLFTNENMKTRGARLDEAIDIVRLCLGGGFFEYHGKHYAFERLIMEPHPPTKIPIYVGGLTEPALRRAAKRSDGWMGLLHPMSDVPGIVARLKTLRAEYGRENEPFDIMLQPKDAATLDDYKRLEDMGVTHCWVLPWEAIRKEGAGGSFGTFGDKASPQEKFDAVRRFGDRVIAKL